LDALSSATGINADTVRPLADRYRRARHWWRALDAFRLMDGGSQSPDETMVRLALIDWGLPAPTTQIAIRQGMVTAVIAMGYEAPRVGVEFGVATPEFVVEQGWTMIRAADAANPKVVAHLVRMAVVEAGYPLWKLRRAAFG
jgi:hypothetical protein